MDSHNHLIVDKNSTIDFSEELEKIERLAKENTPEGQNLFYKTVSKYLNSLPQENSDHKIMKSTKTVQSKGHTKKTTSGEEKKIEKEKSDIKKVETDISERVIENHPFLFPEQSEYTMSEFGKQLEGNLIADELIEDLESDKISLEELLTKENEGDNGYLL